MQEPMLFNTTIRENITYGMPDASIEKIKEVAIMANAVQFIESDEINQEEGINGHFIDQTLVA